MGARSTASRSSQAIGYLAARLRDEYAIRELRFRARASGEFAELDLVWTGAIVASDALSLWETEPMRIGVGGDAAHAEGRARSPRRRGLERREQADAHRMVPLSRCRSASRWRRARRRPAPADSRPEYYDFDLFDRIETAGELAERPLADLAYTVFDTETTGLEPSAGDEIISIGAVRIVNGRLLKGEVFEQLVNPRRSDQARVHAHPRHRRANARRRAADRPGAARLSTASARTRCWSPTTPRSTCAFSSSRRRRPASASRSRCSTRCCSRPRSTRASRITAWTRSPSASGCTSSDGIPRSATRSSTGEVFLKLLPLLAERGILTLEQALEASRETYHARLQY